jgi:hypothetical protein
MFAMPDTMASRPRTCCPSRHLRLWEEIKKGVDEAKRDSSGRQSFLVAMAEFRAEGRATPADHSMIAHENGTYGDTWHTPEGFAKFVADLRAAALEETPRPEGRVLCTTLWYVEGGSRTNGMASSASGCQPHRPHRPSFPFGQAEWVDGPYLRPCPDSDE